MESLADLNLSAAPSDGDVLVFNSSSGLWEPQAPASGGGADISLFMVTDDGTSTQLTTGSAVTVTGIWDTPAITSADFSFASGVLTLNSAGTLEITVMAHSWNNANNRHELHVILRKNGSEIAEASTYTSRNNTQDEGGVVIPSYLSPVVAADTFDLQVFDVGVAASIGGSTIPGQTYISAKLYK